MKKRAREYLSDIFALAILAFALGCILGGIYAWLAAKDDAPAQAAQLARIEAPPMDMTADTLARIVEPAKPASDENAVTEATTEAETVAEYIIPDETEIAPVEAYTPAYVIMDGVPLDADVQLAIEQMCADRDIDVAVVLAMIECESGYDAAAVGDGGASVGLMQIQSRWHYDRMERLGVTDLTDGVQNVTVGIDYLDECLDRCGGDYAAALTMYNRGHFDGVVNGYARKVLEKSK